MGETADRLRGRTTRALALVGGLLVVWMALAAVAARAATLSVCPHGCRYSQVSDAVAAARTGDTVRVSPGTYRGGFTIDKDLTLAGSGAPGTVIRGGGPVITIGTELGAAEPTVSIRGVTITRGLTQGAFGDTVEALGGGVYIPAAADFAPGATVTISDSVITDNTAAPSTSVEAGFSCGPTGPCTFAHAGGGGVDSWGHLTLDHSAVTNNQAAGSLTSDANGAGIYSQEGSLTVRDSLVAGNRATVVNGRFAEGAGIMADTFFSPDGACDPALHACALTIERSVISGNTSTVRATLPVFGDDGQLIDMGSNAGGIHVGDAFPTTVQDTAIVDNAATASDPNGEPNAIDGAMIVGASSLAMRNVSVSFNRTLTTNATTADFGPNGGPLELDGGGQLTQVSMIGNVSKTSSPGDAAIIGGVGIFANDNGVEPVTVRDSVFNDNSAEADSQSGSVQVLGGGVFNNALLDMRGVQVSDNRLIGRGPAGEVQGGGIWSGVDLTGPPVELTLAHSSLTRNIAAGSPGIATSGGGIFNTSALTLLDTRVALNRPDQCVGCGAQSFTARRRAVAGAARHRPAMATPVAQHRLRTRAAGRP